MNIERLEKTAFVVVGKKGSTSDGAGFIQRLWDDAEAPEGWTKWVVPGYEYLCVEREADDTVSQAIKYLKEHNIPLVGAVHDFTDPQTGKSYMYFPVKRL